MSHNLAGFPDGIAGQELLARMRAQAERYGAQTAKGQVELLEKTEHGFVAVMVDGTRHSARRVLLATEPRMCHRRLTCRTARQPCSAVCSAIAPSVTPTR